ncbi:hypothetical protein [Actinoplanes auranticolor]|uniref:YXWGXW repeat-containing protein n=1 Tax=Actinoplanes auranticolor TaxID=47988 RepID=A0A919S514_9ACTN|nr:hypothetical protein [Actinoplanes auranticolor]GIM65187.1 hypothetical protein Aau02nite_15320 [Actinoplanes auranticolor]
MRRPGLLLAAVLLATGSSLAVSAPASASDSVPDHRRHCWYQSNGHWFPWHHNRHNWDDWDDGDRWSAGTPSRDDRRRHCYRYRGGGGGVVIISTGGGRR